MGHIAHQNQSYFNKEASSYDSKHGELLQTITAKIRENLDFIGADWAVPGEDGVTQNKAANNPSRLLDYACGTGMVSRAIGPYLDQCVGVDISEQMVAVYNERAKEEESANKDMFAVVGDLTVPEDPEPEVLSGPEYRDFAIAAVGGGFHHFERPELAAQRLAERLRPGGVLLIWDFLAHDSHDTHGHSASHTIAHHGFTEEKIKKMFEDAGAGDNFRLVNLGDYTMSNHGNTLTRRVFIARGQKNAEAQKL